jgi:protein-tyrosine phosphatase
VSRWFESYGLGEVDDGLLIGAFPQDRGDVERLRALGVDRVLNLVEDEEYPPGCRPIVQATYELAGIEEHRMAIVDFGRLPPAALEDAVALVADWLDGGLRVYVHCRAGWQRSAAVAAGVLARRHGLEIDTALVQVQVRKPTANPLPHQREDLRRWWALRQPAG